MVMRSLACGVALAVAAIALLAAKGADPKETLAQADKLFDEKNYREAADLYADLLAVSPRPDSWVHASNRIITCHVRLQRFDDALAAAEAYIARATGTPQEARAERLTGNLYLTVPHWGTRAGGKFLRAQHVQGIYLQSHQFDKRQAVAHLERARDLYARLDADAAALASLPEAERTGWRDERIECTFDLASAASRFGIYENSWNFWYFSWVERDDEASETVGDRDFEETRGYWELRRKRPIGLRLDPKGDPIFATMPREYRADLPDDEKLLFLLAEARELDRTQSRKWAGLSFYRQAMLARARFGMDRLNSYAGMYYWGGSFPLKEELEKFNPWELADDEALVLAGGQIRKVKLPGEWNVLGLLRTVTGDHAKCGIADEAGYAAALYHQTRQQYTTAIERYEELKQRFPQSAYVRQADQQIGRIRQPEAQINQTGVQLTGDPVELQLSYRNTVKVWFVARRIDHEGFLRALRDQPFDPEKGLWSFWSLQNWHGYFVRGFNEHDRVSPIAAGFIGAEAARWSAEVKDDGTHRYAQATLGAPLKEAGAYLVYAYLVEPPASEGEKRGRDALEAGASRAIFVLSDLALVEKKVKQGNLYYICDARGGAPIAGAKISVLEIWSTWDQGKRASTWHKQVHDIVTDAQGIAVLERPTDRGAQLHTLVAAGPGRLAWSGMGYWDRYSPSRMQEGIFAYCITDRPVYRPDQTVRYKVWLRRMTNGILANMPGEQVSITIYDTRGNKVYEVAKQTDQFGGVDGDFTLGAEPPLGMYRIQIAQSRQIGGQSFRVEEYKKPEFEVAVVPGATHAKLGDKLTASIKATYYFGGPVTDATVSYKVFREEYTHRYYFPGPWDWLYGPGYGLPWYECSWFPWWGRMRCCFWPPDWWWGYYGGARPSSVRELVKQGEGPIGNDGTLAVEIDTASALRDHPDRDHRYVIQADVRDASRRVISGEGAVTVTRQAYYAFVQSDHGYARPGEEMVIRIRCLTPGNEPVKTEGVVTVSSVVFGGPDNARIEETELNRWKAETDAEGLLEFRLRHERSGQLKIKFEAPDQWGGVVEGYGLVWVCGRDFNGELHRFNDLELITDKRTYRPGEVAHIMINTKQAGSYVLFSDDVDSNHLLAWKLLHIPQRSIVVDVPIRREHQPNFFVEGTTVAAARVHQQASQICVPPEKGVIDVTVAPDKASYKPGEQAQVAVTARTLDGTPVEAQITLSAFDKSVLYIQPELTPPIAKFFHGNVRYHAVRMATNLVEQLSAWGSVRRPFEQLDPVPGSWWGVWGPTAEDLRQIAEGELEIEVNQAGVAGGFGERRARASLESANGLAMDRAAPAAPMEEMAARSAGAKAKAAGGGAGGAAEPEFAEAQVRTAFADTAAWLTTLTTDAAGKATATFRMPENLTTWKINTWCMTRETKVGQADSSAVTTKDLLVRLQAPRFFMEYDEVVVSANVHNYLKDEKTARVSLEIPEKLLRFAGGASPATVDVKVPAGGERRVDWRLAVLSEGTAALTIKALTDTESDAMQMRFPVLVHGITKQIATTGSMRPDDEKKTLTVELLVPDKRRPELTRLEVMFAPTLAGAMMDALPYCIYYPYGCTEQTMSRFLPCVLTLKTLRAMGIKLEDVRKIRGRMEEIRKIEQGEHRSIYCESPIFDDAELNEMIAQSLSRIANMQHGDGGWGWWVDDSSSGYLSSYVLFALATAQECDVAVNEQMIDRGMRFLANWEAERMREKEWSPHAEHAFVAYVLSLKGQRAKIEPAKDDTRPGDLIERLHGERDKLGLYGKALLCLALANHKDLDRARTVLRNIMQYKEENAETQVAWFRTPNEGWWYWWNSDIESNAWVLRAITKLDPKSEVGPRLVKWLLNNRRNGYYWRSTRDTTLCIAALGEFALASGETDPDYTLRLDYDGGAVVKEVKINRDSFFTYDNKFVLEGVTLGGGKHTLAITKTGRGALYFNTYLRYFTKEEHITAAGHELKVDRAYAKLVQIPYEVEVEGAQGQKVKEQRLRYERKPVRHGDEVASGDVILVELKVTSDNDYTYLCFEDMKPAGCEPTEVRSGGKGQEGFASYMELRDEKVVFFVNAIGRGEHLMRYRLRAEIPGAFHALPTVVYGMYTPELRANSEELLLKIVD